MSEAEHDDAQVKRKQRDSSLTRVVPVFEALSRQQDGCVTTLLDLAAGEVNAHAPWRKLDMRMRGSVACGSYGRGLNAPESLLRWLAANATLAAGENVKGSTDTIAKRTELPERDEGTIAEALDLIESTSSGKGWHLLEGASFPDAYIETREAIIVVEGIGRRGQ